MNSMIKKVTVWKAKQVGQHLGRSEQFIKDNFKKLPYIPDGRSIRFIAEEDVQMPRESVGGGVWKSKSDRQI